MKESEGILSKVGGSLQFGTQAYNQTTVIVGALAAVVVGVIGYYWGKSQTKKKRR